MKYKETEAKPTYSKTVKLLIDADSLIYRAAHAGEKEYNADKIPKEHPLFKEMSIGTMHDKQVEIFHSMIAGHLWKIKGKLNANGIDIEDYKLIFTPKKAYCDAHNLKLNFRYEIIDAYNAEAIESDNHPGYKANRRGMTLPEGIPELFDYVATLQEAVFVDHAEADDYVYRAKVNNMGGVLIACLDKDIYSGTPSGDLGHYNYNKEEWIYTTKEEANLFYYRQCLAGDSSDGIKGIHRYGPKTAEKDFPEWTNHKDIWKRVLSKFEEKGYTEEYAILMYRLVFLGQLDNNYNLTLWSPPN